jgi:hypothetical protein
MKNKLFILPISIFALFCCSNKQKNVICFDDVKRECEIVISNSNLSKSVFSIHLIFQGEIDGNADITIADGINFKQTYKIKKGQVNYNIDTDWYSPKCYIKYSPQNVINGKLFVKYKFFEL